jgi:CHAD domain-containing protein
VATTVRTEFLIPGDLSLDAARAALSTRLRLEAGAVASIDRTFYDTADGRLHASRLRLVRENGTLAILDASREVARAALAAGPSRIFEGDLPAGRLHDLLAPIIEMRALTPVARVRSRLLPLRVVDDEAKTVVRLTLEEPAVVLAGRQLRRLDPRLHVTGVRGYEGALRRVTRTLEEELAFSSAGTPLLDSAVTESGGVPGGVSSRLALAFRPEQRADSAATLLLVHLAGTIAQNLPGALADVDSEFLHDLRVAVRRTRSAQRQLQAVFPPEALAGFRTEFRWLQQVTGPTRDFDVHLLELDELRSVLPETRQADLAPLERLLVDRRRREQRRMVRALQSGRLDTLLADWSVFLEGLVEAPLDQRPDAARRISDLAADRIGRVYRGMVKSGLAIDDASPPERLHDLRKTGKELRYLLEFFSSLFPGEVVTPMVRTLKALQDTLGRFYDREIQADTLRSLRDEVAVLDGGPAALMAMGLVVSRLEADQAAARSDFAARFDAFAAVPQRALVRKTFA